MTATIINLPYREILNRPLTTGEALAITTGLDPENLKCFTAAELETLKTKARQHLDVINSFSDPR